VRRVRRTQHRADPGLVTGLVRRGLRHQRLERLLPADHRKDYPPHRAGQLRQRRLRHSQHRLLATDLLQLRPQFLLDLPLRPGVDFQLELDEQVHQRVGDLRLPDMAQRGQQSQAPWRLHPLQVRRVLLRRPRPPGVHQLLRHVREQVRGQLQPSRRTRSSLFTCASRLSRPGAPGFAFNSAKCDRPLQPRAGRVAELVHRAAEEPLLEVPDRLADQPPHLPGCWRFDVVVAATGGHRGFQPVPGQLHRAQFGGQPPSQPVLVLLGVRAEPVRRPDLTQMPLDRLALPVVVRPRLRRHLHLLSHVLHCGGRYLLGRPREPGLHLEELQQQCEPEPGRPGLGPHPLHIVFEQRSDLDQVLRLQVLPHTPPSLTEITRSAQRDAQ
jgi:hypothetical protein